MVNLWLHISVPVDISWHRFWNIGVGQYPDIQYRLKSHTAEEEWTQAPKATWAGPRIPRWCYQNVFFSHQLFKDSCKLNSAAQDWHHQVLSSSMGQRASVREPAVPASGFATVGTEVLPESFYFVSSPTSISVLPTGRRNLRCRWSPTKKKLPGSVVCSSLTPAVIL